MTRRFRYRVDEAAAGQRLDVFLAAQPDLGLSRSQVQRLIDAGHATVGGRVAKAGWKLEPGDEVEIEVPPPPPMDLTPEEIPLDVVYEDEDVLVINKPRGLVVHPAAGHWTGTLVHAVLGRLRFGPEAGGEGAGDGSGAPGRGPAGVGAGGGAAAPGSVPGREPDLGPEEDPDDGDPEPGDLRPGIVHRLDKDTTGLLVVAKHPQAQQALAAQIRDRVARREYLALVHGDPGVEAGRVEAPIGRHPRDRKRMAVVPRGGREAVTHFRVLERFRGFSLLLCRLETGRTHQIRVHLAYIGHPVAGDPVYGPRKQALGLTAQALHAFRLGFYHPRTGQWLEFEAPLPPDFAGALERLRAEGK
ncbi:MAG: RluA family pseudouridine synthase [Firmicutes bacterium]|nr:RluA family pseudouridine synthase [Bacillota bacterium]